MDNPHNFSRTTCACAECVKCCKRQPGPLAPGDYKRIQERLGATDAEMESMFCASPGALVKTATRTVRVGSIVPRYRRGRCVFLDDKDRCRIHEVAPFGCAYFDTHMSGVTAMPRSVWLAKRQMEDEEYQRMRARLPYTTTYKPVAY